MRISRRALVGIGCGVAAAGRWATARGADEVHESVYNAIYISREGTTVSFRQMENGKPQSSIDLSRPNFQVLAYTRYLFTAAMVKPAPEKVLGIGLGAGAFNRLFNAAFPASALTTVEIDPMILKLAETLTGFRTGPSNRVEIDDGRRFLRHDDRLWDWIVMDPYPRNSQIPPHMTTVEFFETAARHLAKDGAFVLNIVAADALFFALVKTLGRVFPNHAVFNVPGTGNRIFLATPAGAPVLASTVAEAPLAVPARTAALLAENGVDFAAIRHTVASVRLPPGTPVLTDDFAPSEYLGSASGRQ